jgi:hypothetical protein
MATTTPNFGWSVPTSTDLVKDGATAIELLGDSIDASLVDLKGGTTGQVLSKTSNTDMDFTWVTDAAGDITGVTAGTGISGGGTSGTVTVTNSMATAIDAKGDLIGGTGADTFSRLAVGANGTVLTADSAQATGLKWATVSSGSLVLIGTTTISGSGAFNINSVFSSTYDDYEIHFSGFSGSTGSYITFGLRTGSTNATGADYNYMYYQISTVGGIAQGGGAGTTSFGSFDYGTAEKGDLIVKLNRPYLAESTGMMAQFSQYNAMGTKGSLHTLSTSYDSLWVSPTSGTVSGKVMVYGYAK